jgi:prepilin-type N-terminal cleavage/methylation domain-containing protein
MRTHGFTLVELLVSLSLSCVAILLFGTAYLQSQLSTSSIQTSGTRNELSFTIRQNLSSRKALKQTILHNPVMKVAISGLPADYAAVGGSINADFRAYPVDIYDASGLLKLAGKGSDDSGSAPKPVYYTTEGIPCTTPSVNRCLIAATAVMRIQGSPRYPSPDSMFPTKVYPSWDISLKPDFFVVAYTLSFLTDPKRNLISRKPVKGTVFFPIADVEDLVP